MNKQREPKIITLNFTGCKYIMEIHARIKEAFDFPDYYGNNWDAFWDLLRGTRSNTIVEIRGMKSIPAEFHPSMNIMIEILQRNKTQMEALKKRRPQFDCRFEYKIID